MRIVTTTHNSAAILARIADRLPAALQSLSDHEPGYPSTTPGAGSVGGGHGGGSSSPVERLAGRVGTDRVLADREELTARLRRIDADARRVLHIVNAATTHRVGDGGDGGDVSSTECCTNHAERMQDFTRPVYRVGLCRFCYDYRAVEGVAPPLALLEARAANGGRVTAKMVQFAKVPTRGRR